MTEPLGKLKFFEWLQQNLQKPFSPWLLIGIALLGVLFLLLGGGANQGNQVEDRAKTVNTNEVKENSSLVDEIRLETELKRTLEQILGAGRIQVDVTLKAGQRRVWERQSRVNRRTSQERGNTVNNEEDSSNELVLAKDRDGHDCPVLKEELAPEVQGVIVVASGADDIQVRKLLLNTVMTVLGLPAHRVMVLPGGEEKNEIR